VTYIIDAIRTPISKKNGAFKGLIPEELASRVLINISKNNSLLPSQISDIFMASAFGTGGNMARNASLRAFPNNIIAATTIDAQCSGGLRALEIASNFCTHENYVLAGGMESCSLAPENFYNSLDPRFSEKPYSVAEFSPNETPKDSLFLEAENVAKKYMISKEEMIKWTFEMHQRAFKSQEKLEKFICKIDQTTIDQLLKPNLSLEEWQKLQSENLIDRTTAARNADAAVVLLLSKKPENALAKILFSSTVGSDPSDAPEGVIHVTQKLLEKSDFKLEQINAFEISDSFAVNALAFSKKFNIGLDKINKSGGILAFGHAFGATGAINVIHLVASLKKGEIGLVAVPGAGGQATGMIIEKY
jgi:acetyl-CoA C-acetyltransferase